MKKEGGNLPRHLQGISVRPEDALINTQSNEKVRTPDVADQTVSHVATREVQTAKPVEHTVWVAPTTDQLRAWRKDNRRSYFVR